MKCDTCGLERSELDRLGRTLVMMHPPEPAKELEVFDAQEDVTYFKTKDDRIVRTFRICGGKYWWDRKGCMKILFERGEGIIRLPFEVKEVKYEKGTDSEHTERPLDDGTCDI